MATIDDFILKMQLKDCLLQNKSKEVILSLEVTSPLELVLNIPPSTSKPSSPTSKLSPFASQP